MDITTNRLRLLHVPPEWLPILLNTDGSLPNAIDADVPHDWPPEHIDDGIVQFLRSKCIDGRLDPWWMRLIVTRSPRPELVGTCGYKGPPDEGAVEIGYSVVASKQNMGYATEAATGLIAHAFEDNRVDLIRAETLPSLRPSIRVLEKCGFRAAGQRDAPELEEPVLMFELRRMPVK